MYLKLSKINRIFFIGDKRKFPNVYKKIKNQNDKFIFVNCKLVDNNNFKYLENITDKALDLFHEKKIKFLINMPLNKKKFLNEKYEGYTEFFSKKFNNKKNENMILYNQDFSVCPLTTHIKIKDIEKQISSVKINLAIKNIIHFYEKYLNRKVKIMVLGLNPHASQDFSKKNTDSSIIKPAVQKFIKKKINIQGPISADTAFENRKNKIFLGMYHDQVLIPFKLINKFNGINITIGKKLLRLSPDHGTGVSLIKNKKNINNTSFLNCIKFCEKFINV